MSTFDHPASIQNINTNLLMYCDEAVTGQGSFATMHA